MITCCFYMINKRLNIRSSVSTHWKQCFHPMEATFPLIGSNLSAQWKECLQCPQLYPLPFNLIFNPKNDYYPPFLRQKQRVFRLLSQISALAITKENGKPQNVWNIIILHPIFATSKGTKPSRRQKRIKSLTTILTI